MVNELTVLRIARTFPRLASPGVGLQPFQCQKLSKYPSLILTKYDSSPVLHDVNGIFVEVHYRELDYKSLRFNFLVTLSKLWGELFMFLSILKVIITLKPSIKIIHCHSIHYAIGAVVLSKILKVPAVLSIGGTDIRRAARLPLYLKLISRIDAVVYVAKAHDQILKENMPNARKLHLSNGLDNNIFFNRNLNRNNILLSVGNIRWQKGYNHLMEAANIIFKTFPDFEMHIVGSGTEDDISSLKSTLNQGLREKVKFLGIKTQTEIAYMMNEAKLLLLPSVSEGLPKVLLESQAAGLPIISTNVGDCADVVAKAGFIVESENPYEIANATQKLLQDERLYSEMRRNCLINAKRYSWEAVVRKLDKLYETLINER